MSRDDHRVAADLAHVTGQALMAQRSSLFAQHGDDTAAIKDAGDALAQSLLAASLYDHRPDDVVLSEEAPDDLARLDARRVWIIDPLDGTREYARAGRVDWAVHVALWDREAGGLTAGAVALPEQGVTLTTAQPHPVDVAPLEGRRLRLVVSGSRRPAMVDRLAAVLPADITVWGSAGAKAARVIVGQDDVYLHDTDLNEWDAAAPVAVARAHGLIATALDGSDLVFNKRRAINGSLLMGRPDAVALVRAALSTLT